MIKSFDSRLAIGQAQTLDQVRSATVAQPRLSTALILGFASLELLLAVLGIGGVQPFDPRTFALVLPSLGAVALLACYLPARRAARIDPARVQQQH